VWHELGGVDDGMWARGCVAEEKSLKVVLNTLVVVCHIDDVEIRIKGIFVDVKIAVWHKRTIPTNIHFCTCGILLTIQKELNFLKNRIF
jgi:hypothetical protein